MCRSCWEGFGSPLIRNEATSIAVERLRAVDEGGSIGLHIVVDDWNIDDESISHELTVAEPESAERKALEHLLTMTVAERATALALNEGFIT